MNDRVNTICSTQAAAAFPGLAKFLAESTSLAPDICEHALRAAAGDYVAAERQSDMKGMWRRAVDNANASISIPPESAPAAADKPANRWAAAVEAANAHIGAI